MAIQFDSDQRAAVEVRSNAVVSAGAGSGKTTVLSSRFLQLILNGEAHVDEILTLTFTRKAAAEMYERIHQQLLDHQDSPGMQQELSRFDRAHISTLDSFCAQIVRSDCMKYGISPAFVQDNERCRQLAEETALEFLLARQESPALKRLLALGSFEQILNEMFIPLAQDHITMAGGDSFAVMLDRQLRCIRKSMLSSMDWIDGLYKTFLSYPEAGNKTYTRNLHGLESLSTKIFPLLRKLLANLEDSSGGSGNTSADDSAASAEDSAASPETVSSSASVLELFSRELKKFGRGNSKNSEALNFLEEEKDELNDAVEALYQGLQFLSRREELKEIMRLAQEFQDAYTAAKQESELLDFQDVASMAVDILVKNRELRRFYKEQFSFIMIDEFQDNNDLQKRLLYLLAEKRGESSDQIPRAEQLEPGKLFFVGDEKQSIYRFRGADVSVFKGLKGELEAAGGKALNLRTNYRSDPALIDFFNRVFPSVMEHEGEDYEADFLSLQAKPSTEASASVSLFYKPLSSETEEENQYSDDASAEETEQVGSLEAEAWFTAKWIEEAVRNRTLPLPAEDDTEEPRFAGFDDIAILLRTTSNQLYFERALRRLGIPYTTQAARALFLEAPVNDMYLFLEVLAYPMDRNAYAALLRSPFCNLDDRLVTALMHTETEPFALDLEELRDPGKIPAGGGSAELWRSEILQEHSDAEREDESATERKTDAGGDLEKLEKLVKLADVPGWAELLQQEGRKYCRARELFLSMREKADCVPLTELIRDLWYRGGYRYMVLKRPAYHSYLEYYDYLYALAAQADDRGDTLALFLDTLRPKMGSSEKLPELELLREGTRGVQIMTIHKSKGLEFPVIILADTGGGSRSGGSGMMYWSDEFGPSFKVVGPLWQRKGPQSDSTQDYFSRMEKKRLEQMETAEKKRLLYVGMTRAEQHLVISGCRNTKNRNAKVLLNMLLDGLGVDGDALEEASARGNREAAELFSGWGLSFSCIPDYSEDDMLRDIRGQRARDSEEMQQLISSAESISYPFTRRNFTVTELQRLHHRPGPALPPNAAADEEAPAEEASAEAAVEAAEAAVEAVIEANPAAFGSLCHRMIELRIEQTAAETEEITDEYLRSLGLPEDERGDIIRKAELLTDQFFASPAAKRLESAKSIEAELPFMLHGPYGEGGRNAFVRGQMDLTAEFENEILVVDFKTDREFAPEQHELQMRLYRDAAAGLYGKPVSCMLYYLRGGKTWTLS